jgi:hypothetical protein
MDIDFGKALAGVTALAAAFAALATATGVFDQMQRNEPGVSALIFCLAAAAGVLIVLAGIATNQKLEGVLVWIGLGCFAVAAVLGLIFLVLTRSDHPPPAIKVQVKSDPELAITGTISAEQLTSSKSLKVNVFGVRPTKDPNGFGSTQSLFKARLGSDASGSVELPISVPIAPKLYRWATVLAWIDEKPGLCRVNVAPEHIKETGCVIVRVPGTP